MRASRRPAGFTLLELLVAAAIFALVSTLILVFMDNSSDHVLRSIRARELRVLAERKLGEIEVFEREFDDIFSDESLDDYGEQWEGWEWGLEIRDVVIYGTTSDEAAEYLFGDPEEDDENDATGDDATEPEPEGETQFLRELTLTVKAPDDISGESDSVTIVTFLPLVDYAGAGPGGGNGGGAPDGGN